MGVFSMNQKYKQDFIKDSLLSESSPFIWKIIDRERGFI